MAKAAVVRTAWGMPRTTNHTWLWIENCSGVKIADGRMRSPTTASALAGFLRYTRSKYFPITGSKGRAPIPLRLRMMPRWSTLVMCRFRSR